MLCRRSVVGTNEMPYLQLGFSFGYGHLHERQVEASASFFASPKKLKGKEEYLNLNEIYKFTNSQIYKLPHFRIDICAV